MISISSRSNSSNGISLRACGVMLAVGSVVSSSVLAIAGVTVGWVMTSSLWVVEKANQGGCGEAPGDYPAQAGQQECAPVEPAQCRGNRFQRRGAPMALYIVESTLAQTRLPENLG